MPSELEIWIELAAITAVVVMFPLYLGFVHVGPAGALAYAAAGGIALTISEHLQFRVPAKRPLHPAASLRRPPPPQKPGRVALKHAAIDAGLWVAAITGVGGIVYLLALIFL